MSALKDAFKGIGSQIQIASPLGTFLQKLADLGDTLSSAIAAITVIFASRFAERATSGGAIVVTNGNSASVVALDFSTDNPNEKIGATFTASRSNTGATQVVHYQFFLDAVAVGVAVIVSNVGLDVVTIADIITVPTTGAHTLEVQAVVSALGGDEHIEADALITAVGYGVL